MRSVKTLVPADIAIFLHINIPSYDESPFLPAWISIGIGFIK